MSSNSSQHDDSSGYADELIEGHEYDGIKEYDNPMPGWWLWLFYATIAWSVFYIAGLGLGLIDDYDAQLERGQERIAEKQRAAATDAVAFEEDELQAMLDDDDALDEGRQVYDDVCAVCHGDDGGGGVGSAFNDGQWDHDDTMVGHYEIVRDGIDGVGMPAHDNELSEQEMATVVAYIQTF